MYQENEQKLHQGKEHERKEHQDKEHEHKEHQSQDNKMYQIQNHGRSIPFGQENEWPPLSQDNRTNEWSSFGQDNRTNEWPSFGRDNKTNERQKSEDHEKNIVTGIKEVPVTMERKVQKDLIKTLGNAGLPRATIAASKEVPNGTPGGSTNKTVLQQHVEFFDTDNNGVISPLDTWKGLRKLGFSLAFSALSVSVIHSGFSYPTQKSWIPFFGNPFFNVYVDTLYKAKHGSDSETFDTEGRFVPEKFEETFSKYSCEKDALNLKDIIKIIRGNANVFDPFGWIAATFEWGTLYLLCAKDGKVYKEDARTCYDGTLFFKMENEEEKRKKGVPIIKSSTEIKKEE